MSEIDKSATPQKITDVYKILMKKDFRASIPKPY
jgi:hypothetical protein